MISARTQHFARKSARTHGTPGAPPPSWVLAPLAGAIDPSRPGATYDFGHCLERVILEATDDPGRGVLSCHLHADGRFAEDLYCEAPGSKYHPRVTPEMITSGSIYPRMEGQKVFKNAVVRSRTAFGRSTVSLSYLWKGFGANNFYGGNAPSREWTNQTLLTADRRFDTRSGWNVAARGSYRTHGDHFIFDQLTPALSDNRHRTHEVLGGLTASRPLGTAGSFTAVSGWGMVAIGVLAIVVAIVASLQKTATGALNIWLASALLSPTIMMWAMVRKARSAKMPLLSGPGRKFVLSFSPPMIVGALLTLVLYRAGLVEVIPGVWLLLYGTAVVAMPAKTSTA